jgi:hypothetical protein
MIVGTQKRQGYIRADQAEEGDGEEPHLSASPSFAE